MTEHTHVAKADEYFAIIPEWVLYADISANAVRLYCVFRRYADQNGQCFPGRKALAEKCRVSEATVDRLIDELVGIGALQVRNRRTESGQYLSSIYKVFSTRGVYSPTSTGVLTHEYRGVLTSDDITKASKNESHEPEQTHMLTVPVSEPAPPSDFTEFWELYPRKVGKTKAQKVWGRLSKQDRVEAFTGLQQHLRWWRVKQVAVEFIPHPTSWLNARRWEDELGATPVASTVQGRSAPGMDVIRRIMQGGNNG